MNNESNKNYGISLSSILGVAFIVLKLCKVINWSWLWVLSPFWISVVLCLFAFFGLLFSDLYKTKKSKNEAVQARKRKAELNKDKWQTGTPTDGYNICFRANNIWHNGCFKNGVFYIVGDSKKTPYQADVWYRP